MEIRGLSATGIRDFLQCKLKVVFRYDREIPSIKNDHARIGIAVHEALEQFTRRMLAKKSFPDSSDYEFAITQFMNCATEEGLGDMGFYADGKQMITEFIDRYDPSEEIVDVEHFFKIETPDGVPIVGAMDKVRKLNDDTIEIVDYKTSRNAMTAWQLKDDIQLSMYDLAASIIWPEYSNRVLTLDYVRINKTVSSYRTSEQRETFREFLVSVWHQMNKLDENEVRGRINNLCGWCDYKTYCPAYAEFVKSQDLKLTPLAEMDNDEFLEHWVQVSDMKNTLESRQREMKMIASEKAVQGESISSKDKELYTTQAARTNYDVDDVAGIIPEGDLLDVLAVNKSKLDRYLKERPDLRDSLSRVAKVSYNAPVYRVKEIKNNEKDANDRSDSDTNAA
ncbi:MAG: hypothetical protein GF334_10780 [Candidatus Altiarchaeales archaeon]|nr:hypothetical protein [Candidatus Altiarchaeales archaeon]